MISSVDTICALSTPVGQGAIGVVRISGEKAIPITEKITRKDLTRVKGYQSLFASIYFEDEVLDETIVTVFRNPQSFTGEDVVEISCHGSMFILQKALELMIDAGCRAANPGEFSIRAYLNGKMDLSQAEAIADLIASGNAASHRLAMHQMRGGYSSMINELREKLIHFASLLELELDFSEEDVEFADRPELKNLIDEILGVITKLIESFKMGNAIKKGIPIAIVGSPNAGKSTLLNALLKENRAIVSDIAGTTRDTIEDETTIGGIGFRFIDTAGIRETSDTIENLGIERTFDSIKEAMIILWLVDVSQEIDSLEFNWQKKFMEDKVDNTRQTLITLANKTDVGGATIPVEGMLPVSAKTGQGVGELETRLVDLVKNMGYNNQEMMLTNVRHLDCLKKTKESLGNALKGMEFNLSTDLVAIDIRHALHHLGEVTGTISTDDLLGNIFSKFCIGK